MIQPIPTKYKGITFRSRIEARTAIFLDALRVQWQYEKEGYFFNIAENIENDRLKKEDKEFYAKRHKSGLIPYLPDFYIPNQARFKECFIEVKGKNPTNEEHDKARLLCHDTKLPIFFLWDFPFIEDNNSVETHLDGYYYNEKGVFNIRNAESLAWGYNDCFCEYGEKIVIANEAYFTCKIGDTSDRVTPCIDAYNAARNVKF